MDELQAKHRKELRELQGKITQKKKAASKKTRKGVNDECETLERELKERHEQEIAIIAGVGYNPGEVEADVVNDNALAEDQPFAPLEQSLENLSITAPIETLANESAEVHKKRPNRQKARLARRAAEQEAIAEQAAAEAASLPDLREVERKQMADHFSKYGLEEKEIRADGHCLYSAIADQMNAKGLGLKPIITPKIAIKTAEAELVEGSPEYKVVRAAAADYIVDNKADFEPFLEESLQSYVHKVRNTGEWGGHMELMALANAYDVRINVLHGDGRIDKIEPGTESKDAETIWLGYYRHGFGLGEHYNSLRKSP